jgi:hypothetical protein
VCPQTAGAHAKVQFPATQEAVTPRNICVIFLNLYGGWQENNIFTVGVLRCLGVERKFRVYTPNRI